MTLKKTIDLYSERIEAASKDRRFTDAVKILDEFRAEMRLAPPSESEIAVLLNEIYESKSSPGCQYGFIAAWSNLSPVYVPVLCDILCSEECKDAHEPAIELLAELADQRAFGALKKAVSYRWDYDQWYHVPRKALQGLSRIGGEKAVRVIKNFANSPIEEIRNEANELLLNVTG